MTSMVMGNPPDLGPGAEKMFCHEWAGLAEVIERARQTPQASQERRPDEVRRIDEEHGTPTDTGFPKGRFQFLVEEAGLFVGVFLDSLLRRHRDRSHLAVAQAEVGLEEGTDLGQTWAHSCLLKDDLGGLFGAPRRVVPEILPRSVRVATAPSWGRATCSAGAASIRLRGIR